MNTHDKKTPLSYQGASLKAINRNFNGSLRNQEFQNNLAPINFNKPLDLLPEVQERVQQSQKLIGIFHESAQKNRVDINNSNQ